MMYLKYLKQHEEEFIKEIGVKTDALSYKDWVNQERKLNDIYQYILNGGRTFKHKALVYEGFISPCTIDDNRWQFTMFNESKLPFGHTIFNTFEEMSRDILDKNFEIVKHVYILN